jgi:hypothetical protein
MAPFNRYGRNLLSPWQVEGMFGRVKALALKLGGEGSTTGAAGEKVAEQHLVSTQGIRVLARNWRHGRDELDLVCLDGETLVFVEVKMRRSGAQVPGYFHVKNRAYAGYTGLPS